MLSLNHVEVFYGESQALYDVSLDVQEGEICALIGANGAGKTTTLRAISGILRPKNGTILFNNQALHKMPVHQIVELGISHVPEGRGLFPMMSIRENLMIGGHCKRVIKSRLETLERMYVLFPRLKEREKQLAGTLSGGEQQMVAIARGLMSQPKMLILDEPSLGLAPLIVAEVFRIVKEISKNTTVLLVEQNVGMSMEIADRVFVLEQGSVVMTGKGNELLNSDHIRKAYLGM